MDIFDSQYYKLNKSLLIFIGLWPYANGGRKWVARCVTSGIMLSFILPLVGNLKEFAG